MDETKLAEGIIRIEKEALQYEQDALYEVYTLFSNYAEQHNERYLQMHLSRTGAGSIIPAGEPGCNEWLAWDDLYEAPGKLRQAIAKWEQQEKEENGD